MEAETQELAGKFTSEELSDVLAQLSTDQIRFVVARQECNSDKEAAEAIGIAPGTVYHWPDAVKRAVRLMAQDGIVVATHVRRRNLAKAMLTKVAGLDSIDESVRQRVATEIIEWEMGKATQPVDQHNENSGEVTVRVVYDRSDDGVGDGD